VLLPLCCPCLLLRPLLLLLLLLLLSLPVRGCWLPLYIQNQSGSWYRKRFLPLSVKSNLRTDGLGKTDADL
jgi:hypothetical protein